MWPVERVEDDVGGAVAKRLLELIDHLSAFVGCETSIGNGGPSDMATELLELVALVGLAADLRPDDYESDALTN